MKNSKKKKKDGVTDPHLIPMDTKIEARLEPNEAANCVELVLATNYPEALIKLVAVFGEQIFDGESHVVVRSLGSIFDAFDNRF